MKEQTDKARVAFGCAGCDARADAEADLIHDDKPHTRKLVRRCTRSGTLPHAVRPPGTLVTKGASITERWYGFRLRKPSGFTAANAKQLPQDTLVVLVDKEARDTLLVQVDPKHGARTLEELTKVVHAQLKPQVASIGEREEIDFAGAKAVRIAYETAGAPRRRVTQVFIKHGGDFLIFSATDIKPFDNHAKAVRELFDSVELLK